MYFANLGLISDPSLIGGTGMYQNNLPLLWCEEIFWTKYNSPRPICFAWILYGCARAKSNAGAASQPSLCVVDFKNVKKFQGSSGRLGKGRKNLEGEANQLTFMIIHSGWVSALKLPASFKVCPFKVIQQKNEGAKKLKEKF